MDTRKGFRMPSKIKKKAVKRKSKKPKLESKAKIRRRLFRLWSLKIMEANGNVCAVTGEVRGEERNGKPIILDGHHLESRYSCKALRFDILGGIALNKSSHKFGRESAHKGPIWFAEWLRIHRPKQYAYVLEHRADEINLEDRKVLAEIEAKLKSAVTDEELDILGML